MRIDSGEHTLLQNAASSSGGNAYAESPAVWRRRVSLTEYYKMAEAGIIDEDDRVELIEGELLETAAVGILHLWCVNRLSMMFARAVPDDVFVSVQNPIYLGEYSEPEPDIVLYAMKEQTRKPAPRDILLLVEVSDATLQFDRERKLPLYAQYGIQEVWIANLTSFQIEVYRKPKTNHYQERLFLNPSDSVAPLAFPKLTCSVEYIVGKPTPRKKTASKKSPAAQKNLTSQRKSNRQKRTGAGGASAKKNKRKP
jgi:Uma2 family endonuclease